MTNKLILLGLLLAGVAIYISCMDPIKSKNRQRYKPEGWFEGEQLPLARAIYNGEVKEIKRQVKEQGINPDSMSPNGRVRFLMYACIMEDSKAVKTLLDLGADPNKVSPMRRLREGPESYEYEIPLSFAVARGNWEITKLLLEYKANPNTLIGELPLSSALSRKNDREWLDLLFRYGADAAFREYGSSENVAQTALTLGRYELIPYLLEKGADPLSPNRLGNSLAYSLQEKLNNHRGTEEGRKKLLEIKELLSSRYKVEFPAKEQNRRGMEQEIRCYTRLPKEIKELYGMDKSAKYFQKVKDSLDQGKTLAGRPLEEE